MLYPKIIAANAVAPCTLLVTFSDLSKKKYDISSLLVRYPKYAPLQYLSFLKNLTIEPGGHGISWNEDIDISEYEILTNGETITSL